MSAAGAPVREAPGLFTRKATGLVREARGSDALFYNVMWASVALAFAFAFLLYGGFYLGSNLLVAAIIAALLGLPGAFLYAMLSQTMPRSGGDYVFNSRALHPSIGFAGKCVPGSLQTVSGGSVDDVAVGDRLVVGAEPKQRLEAGHRRAAAVVAKDELIQVDGQVLG